MARQALYGLVFAALAAGGCVSIKRADNLEANLIYTQGQVRTLSSQTDSNTQRIGSLEARANAVDQRTANLPLLEKKVEAMAQTPSSYKLLEKGNGHDYEFGRILQLALQKYNDEVLRKKAENANGLIITDTSSDFYQVTPVKIEGGFIKATYNDLDNVGDVTAFRIKKTDVPSEVQRAIADLRRIN